MTWGWKVRVERGSDSFHKHTLNVSFNGTRIIISIRDTGFSLSHSHRRMTTWWKIRWYQRESVPKLLPLIVSPLLLRAFFVPQTGNTNWNYTEKSAVKPAKCRDTLAEIISLRFRVYVLKSVKMRIMRSIRGQRTSESLPPRELPRPNFIPIKCFSIRLCPADLFAGERFLTRVRKTHRVTWMIWDVMHFRISKRVKTGAFVKSSCETIFLARVPIF